MNILVVAPHPDDETIALGGTIAKFSNRGFEVHVLVVSGHLPPLYKLEDYERTVTEAHQAFKLMEGTLAKFNLGFNDVFKCLVMIDDISQWGLFNTVYTQYFDKPYPARSAFGADGLALNASFEMECMAYISD